MTDDRQSKSDLSITQVISLEEIEETWKISASNWLQNEFRKLDFSYHPLTSVEQDESLIQTVSALLSALPRSGAHRQNDWESGWWQNLEDLERNSDEIAVIPKYFSKFNLVRWRQKLVAPVNKNMEAWMLGFILDWISDELLGDFSNIYEFGAGTGHNLLRFRKRHDSTTLWGLDWANSSQKIIQQIAERRADPNIRASCFDYFNPDETFQLADSCAVVTVASLEQIGTRFEPFLNYLMKNSPSLVIHVEPIGELLDQNNLMDYLSLEYFKKRNYLSGYLTRLRELESRQKIEIIMAQRSYMGSFFIDGYSIVVWRPVVS
jgi:hypothetical protein